jgi:hypothetical protein
MDERENQSELPEPIDVSEAGQPQTAEEESARLLDLLKSQFEGFKTGIFKPEVCQISQAKQGLDDDEVDGLYQQAKKEVYHLPESMFLSQKAMAKVEAVWEKYEFVDRSPAEAFALATDCQDETIIEELEILKDLEPEKRKGVRCLLTIKDGQVIGYTSYNLEDSQGKRMIWIIMQITSPKHPGTGLGMLNELIKKYQDGEADGILISTSLLPMGLGNLGFNWEHIPSEPEILYYEKMFK